MLDKQELCEILSDDYAEKSSKAGRRYNEAYEYYYQRCEKRKHNDLYQQYVVQGLDKKPSTGFLV